MPTNQVRLRESGTLQCGAVDDSKPVVPRVKILGWESRNRRRYLPESVNLTEYEGIKVNLNHPDGPNKQRAVQERFGWFEAVSKEGDGLYGDFHYNPELPFAKPFAWYAKHKPDMIGMSHDAVGAGKTENGVFIVEKVHPNFVDLVADSASTKGLYEAMEPQEAAPPDDQNELDDLETHIKNAVAAICADDSLDLKEKVKKIRAALKLLAHEDDEEEEEEVEEEEGEESEEEEEESEKKERKAEESLQTLLKKQPGVRKLVEELDRVKTALALREKNELARRLCQEAKLPSVAVSATFLSLLLEAKDEKAMRQLIEDRKQIVAVQRPVSTGPLGGSKAAAMSNKDFATVIREGR